MKFVFVSTPTFEEWDWSNPDSKGIGGSETSHIEMAQRLARRGHEVLSYAPTPFEGPMTDPAGVVWRRIQQLVTEPIPLEPDVWVVYRAPHVIDMLPDDAVIWHINQDVDYTREGDALTEDRCKRLARLVALCNTHHDFLKYMHPAANVVVSSNGVKRQFIEEIAANPPARNPRRLMYASSPDRGMEFLLQIFPRVREMVPDLELHIYYGFDNIDKVVEFVGKSHRIAMNTERLKELLTQPGVHYHGRLGQRELLGEWFKTGVWCHPSNFTETSCITCMDAQACGAIPITSPVWAIGENVEHGVFVHGNVQNELIRARYVLEVFRMVVQAEAQDAIRAEMMPWAREHFDWDRFVDQWEDWGRVDLEARSSRMAMARRFRERAAQLASPVPTISADPAANGEVGSDLDASFEVASGSGPHGPVSSKPAIPAAPGRTGDGAQRETPGTAMPPIASPAGTGDVSGVRAGIGEEVPA